MNKEINEINEILNELYEIDGNLKEKETELKKIITKMLEYKPNVKIDENYKTELKQKVLLELEKRNKTFSINDIFKYSGVFLSGALAFVLVVNIFPNILNLDKNIPINIGTGTTDKINEIVNVNETESENLELSFNNDIQKLDNKNAFGDLKYIEDRVMGLGGEQGVGGAGGLVEGKMSTTMVDREYIPKIYLYNLKQGEKLPEIPKSMYVYKKDSNNIDIKGTNIDQIFKTDIIDLSKFNNLGLSNVSIFESVKKGYNINMFLKQGELNIYRNYDSWPNINDEQNKLSINDIPSDEEIIKISDDFANKYSINIEQYDNPIVQNSWKKYYDNIDNKQDFYIPEIMNVVYQFNLDGKGVYETMGIPYGLSSTVNIRDMKVNSFGPIQKLDLKGSKYDLITDEDKILSEVKKGNYYVNHMYRDENENFEEIQVEIGDAKLVYFRKNIFNKEKNLQEEYFVPGLLFKVLTPMDNEKSIYPGEYITVPLVGEFLENDINNVPLIEPR